MRMASLKPLHAGTHQTIITCQITELILSINSFWRLVASFPSYHKDCLFSMVPGYITPHFFSTLMLTITDITFVPITCFAGKSHLYPVTCTAGISFVSYVPLCRNQPHLRSAQEVQIRNTFGLPMTFAHPSCPYQSGICVNKSGWLKKDIQED